MSKIECCNCGFRFRFWLNDVCPNCKFNQWDEWKYNIDWKKWFGDMSKAMKKIGDAL